MKKALVTGHKGFVGSHVYNELLTKGWNVHGIDIKDEPGCDVRDYFRSNAGSRFDLVVHCAAVVGGRATIEGNPLHVAVDLSIDAELFNWAVRTKPGRIIYYSSSAAYPVRLQTNEHWVHLIESDIDLTRIESPDLTYGWAKLSGEMLASHARNLGVPVTVLRPFSGYGISQDLDYPWPSFVKRAKELQDPFTIWGDGTQVRDWVHISDIVGATLTCVEQDIDGPLNIGWGRPTSFLDLAAICCETAGYSPELDLKLEAPKGVQYRVCVPNKLFEVYQPKITLEAAVWVAIKGIDL